MRKMCIRDRYSLSDNIASVNANTNTYAYLSLNYGNALLNLPSIRKILKEIIHSANITKDIMPDFSIPCNSPVNPASQYAVAASQEPADIKGLLTEAGCVQDASGMRSIQVNGRSYPLSLDVYKRQIKNKVNTCVPLISEKGNT